MCQRCIDSFRGNPKRAIRVRARAGRTRIQTKWIPKCPLCGKQSRFKVLDKLDISNDEDFEKYESGEYRTRCAQCKGIVLYTDIDWDIVTE